MNAKSEGKSPFEKLETNELSSIKKAIAVMSGKGGVGKSSVTSLIAADLRKKGNNVGILDADITGPSIPKIFGLEKQKAHSDEIGLYPEVSSTGIRVMSVNLLLDKADTPVIWRGPILANTVKQFYTDVVWGDLDYLLIDLPPGTGDVPLTIMQSIPLDGVIVVSSPQDLARMVVSKSINMAKRLAIPILGIVENMSYVECPDCGKKIYVFGESKVEEAAEAMKIDLLAKLPLDPKLAELCDAGRIEDYHQVNILA